MDISNLPLFEQVQAYSVFGANPLEWIGLLSMVGAIVYLVAEAARRVRIHRKRSARVGQEKVGISSKGRSLPQGDETILLVDDDPAVLRANSRLVGRLGYQVQRALGGQEAVDYIRANHADLIILDLLMPGMDGIETYQRIKKINPFQKAIVLSGFAGPAMVNSIKSLGVSTYLVKPAEAAILAQAIRDEIERAAA